MADRCERVVLNGGHGENMNSEPLILVLEDERAQILTLHAALESIGRVADFSDPEHALDFVKSQEVDAAIVDVHMPKMQLNGIEFVRAVRSFDKDLSVIIRTGDSSSDVADHAIEVQAYRRAIKSRTTVPELRELTRAAISETRQRRRQTRDAAATAEVSRHFEKTLGSVEDELSSSECYKGLIHSMRNQLTALAALAETWSELAQQSDSRPLLDAAEQNKRVVNRMLSDMAAFLDGPFAETMTSDPLSASADVNAALEALRQRFSAAISWTVERKSVTIGSLKESLFAATHPIKLITALRHLIEYCLRRSESDASVALGASYVADIEEYIDQFRGPNLIFNRPSRHNAAGYVCFTVTAGLPTLNLERVQQDFHRYPEDPRTGNLHMLSLALGEERCSVMVRPAENGTLRFHLCIPLAG
jgi:CheY-like chemotaxis protein